MVAERGEGEGEEELKVDRECVDSIYHEDTQASHIIEVVHDICRGSHFNSFVNGSLWVTFLPFTGQLG